MSTPTKRRLLALAFGLAASLLAVELAVRAIGLEPPRPGQDAAGTELTNYLATERNAEGFHDRAWSRTKTPGRQRVLFVGDSFVSGVNVPLADLMHTQVEAELQTRGADVELYNFGSAGWDTVREVAELTEHGLDWQPDAVVIVFFINDATQMDTNPLVVRKLGTRINERNGLMNRLSKAWDYIDWRLTRTHVQNEMLDDYLASYLGSEDQAQLWQACKGALTDAKRLSEEHDFELGLVIFPMLIQLDGDHSLSVVYHLVEEAAAELGIPTLNLLPAFAGETPESLWVSPTNAHPNARAYAKTIEPLTGFLLDAGLVTTQP